MKILIASALFFIAPMGAQAACTAADFSIQNFQPELSSGSIGRRVTLKGDLVNHCSEPFAAQIEVVAKDSRGRELVSKKAWPAGTSNIAPGKSVSFDLGRLFRFRSDMTTFSARIVGVRSW